MEITRERSAIEREEGFVPVVEAVPAVPGGTGRRPRRRRVRRTMVVTHRWMSLALGLVLLVVTTSGGVLLYKEDLVQWTQPQLYHHTHSVHPVTATAALAAANAAYPKLAATSVYLARGVYQASGANGHVVTVDPGTGKVLGERNDQAGVLGFLENLHECAFSCQGYPAYLAVLNKNMPGLGIRGLHNVTIGDFVLGCLALLLLWLSISGLFLWWPGIRRMASGFRVRLLGGRYKRDTDLHKVIGFIALPFLIMWAFTGATFEFPFMTRVGYAILGGTPHKDPPPFTSTSGPGPDITPAAAEAAALRTVGGGHVIGYILPKADDKAAAYTVAVASGINEWRSYFPVPANRFVAVDRRDPSRTRLLYAAQTSSPAEAVFGDIGWGEATHEGEPVGPVVRLIWFAFAMTPLILGATGLSTWLWRRGRSKRRPAEILQATT